MEQNIDLNALLIFSTVLECRSFTEAASRLRMQKSTVSRLISTLERDLNRQLLYRTTRQIEPTPQGRELFARCNQSLSGLLQGIEQSLKSTTPMHGRIRIAAVQDMGVELLSPVLAELTARHPRLQIEMLFDDQVVDMVSQAIDISVRAGKIRQQSYRGRKVGQVSFILVASPKFLERAERVPSIESLDGRDFLAYAPLFRKGYLLLEKNGKPHRLTMQPRYLAGSTFALLRLACEGAGISALPDFLCAREIQQGRLVRVLPGWATPPTPITVITPAKKEHSTTIKAVSEFISRRLVTMLT